MKMRYEPALDIQQKVHDVVNKLRLNHVKLDSISCIRSYGSSSKYTLARCHTLNKIMQKALQRKGFYVLEFLSERFDKQSDEDKIKIIIHELMHIPKTFGGGFRHHDYVCDRNINTFFKRYKYESQNIIQ